jgi:hypothetical protein
MLITCEVTVSWKYMRDDMGRDKSSVQGLILNQNESLKIDVGFYRC